MQIKFTNRNSVKFSLKKAKFVLRSMKLSVFFDWGKLIACQYQIESNLSKVSLKRHFMLLVYG